MSAAAILWVVLAQTGVCFVPADQTAGWKRVDLPPEAPALSAPAEVSQSRSGEEATIHETRFGRADAKVGA